MSNVIGRDGRLFPPPRLIECISIFTPLLPGAVIATGTRGASAGSSMDDWERPEETAVAVVDGWMHTV